MVVIMEKFVGAVFRKGIGIWPVTGKGILTSCICWNIEHIFSNKFSKRSRLRPGVHIAVIHTAAIVAAGDEGEGQGGGEGERTELHVTSSAHARKGSPVGM